MFSTASDARFWDRIARKYATDPIKDVSGYERTLSRTGHYLRSDDLVLEIGCGTGTTALKLAPSVKQLVAIDISSEMIAIARERATDSNCSNVVFEVAAPDAFPCPVGEIDVVLGFSVLHLIGALPQSLRGIHRMLKPGGLFISKTPCIKEMNLAVRLAIPLMRAIGKAPYVRFLNADDLETELKRAGFVIVERDRHGSSRRDPRPFLVAKKV